MHGISYERVAALIGGGNTARDECHYSLIPKKKVMDLLFMAKALKTRQNWISDMY